MLCFIHPHSSAASILSTLCKNSMQRSSLWYRLVPAGKLRPSIFLYNSSPLLSIEDRRRRGQYPLCFQEKCRIWRLDFGCTHMSIPYWHGYKIDKNRQNSRFVIGLDFLMIRFHLLAKRGSRWFHATFREMKRVGNTDTFHSVITETVIIN